MGRGDQESDTGIEIRSLIWEPRPIMNQTRARITGKAAGGIVESETIGEFFAALPLQQLCQ